MANSYTSVSRVGPELDPCDYCLWILGDTGPKPPGDRRRLPAGCHIEKTIEDYASVCEGPLEDLPPHISHRCKHVRQRVEQRLETGR